MECQPSSIWRREPPWKNAMAGRALAFVDAITLATAFVVLKRGKDLFWIPVGFARLALG